ncbi:hypothetical protein ACUOFC_57560 [Escherichia sp. TWPC-MK]
MQEAIKKAFGAIEKEGQLYYKEQKTGKEVPIHESAFNSCCVLVSTTILIALS